MKTIDDILIPEERQFGYYWVKPIDKDWGVYFFGKSWGIYGWWGTGDDIAIYDKDIQYVGEFLYAPKP